MTNTSPPSSPATSPAPGQSTASSSPVSGFPLNRTVAVPDAMARTERAHRKSASRSAIAPERHITRARRADAQACSGPVRPSTVAGKRGPTLLCVVKGVDAEVLAHQ